MIDTLIQIYLQQITVIVWSLMFGVNLNGAIPGKHWLRQLCFRLPVLRLPMPLARLFG